jgi:hypothetical protein
MQENNPWKMKKVNYTATYRKKYLSILFHSRAYKKVPFIQYPLENREGGRKI